MAQISFLDFILAKALAAGLAHEIAVQQHTPPPNNYFVLSNQQQAWEQFKEANKKENMVVCIEFVTEELSESTLFMDLAREHDNIPFLRVKVGEGVEEKFDIVRADLSVVIDTSELLEIRVGLFTTIGSKGCWRCD